MRYYYREKDFVGYRGSEGIDFWGNIGYNKAPEEILQGFNYAKEIKDNWNPSLTSLNERFRNDNNLVFFPKVDTSKVTNMESCFRNCNRLFTIPQLDTRNVTDMGSCFYQCWSLSTVPQLDTSKVTNMESCFSGTSLEVIPQWDFSKVTNMDNCFSRTNIETIPELELTSCKNLSSCFSNCSMLVSVPHLDLSSVTDMQYCFDSCSNLKYVSELKTENVTRFKNCFNFCNKLERIEGISFKSMGSITNSSSFLFRDDSVTTNTVTSHILIKDIGTNPNCTYINATSAAAWGRQSLLDSLLTYSYNRRKSGYSYCTIKLNSSVKSKLTAEEISNIQAKGYIIE